MTKREDGGAAMCYIGRTTAANKHHPVGTVAAAMVDDGTDQKSVAKNLADWVKSGCIIERVPVEWVRKNLFTTNSYIQDAARAPQSGDGE